MARIRNQKQDHLIDKENQHQINSMMEHRQAVLERRFDTIGLHRIENIPILRFHGKLHSSPNGKSFKLVDFVGKYDLVMEEHQHVTLKTILDLYLGQNSQNGIIQIPGNIFKVVIISTSKATRYDYHILDCNQAISEQERMTIRYIYSHHTSVIIRDVFLFFFFFFSFLSMRRTTGTGMTEAFLEKLKEMGISVSAWRGPGRANVANTIGKHSVVQEGAGFCPTRCTFRICGAGSRSMEAVVFFSLVQSVYPFYFCSPV